MDIIYSISVGVALVFAAVGLVMAIRHYRRKEKSDDDE